VISAQQSLLFCPDRPSPSGVFLYPGIEEQ